MMEVAVAALGLCEHCGVLLNMADMPSDAMDVEWRCPKCDGVIGHLSFGFDRSEKGAKKVKWVGPAGEWQDEKPEEPFDLGNLRVFPNPPRIVML